MNYEKNVYRVLNCIPRRFVTIIFAVWAVTKILVAAGIVLVIINGDFIKKDSILEAGNLKTFQGVSVDMTDADYWLKRAKKPQKALINISEVSGINMRIARTGSCNMNNLKDIEKTVNGVNISRDLMEGVIADLGKLTSYYNERGEKYLDEFAASLAAEAGNSGALIEQPCRFLICTTQTQLMAYPTKQLLLEDADNKNMDSNQLASIRLGEPMAALSVSNSGRFFYVKTSNCSGWVEAESVAVCESYSQWLSAWQILPNEALVVTGNSVYLSYSNENPMMSNKELSMGVVLRMVPVEELPQSVGKRASMYNYAVFFPVRLENGTYSQEIALISENADVSVGFLTFTKEHIIKQAYKCLGNVYGWGGMLHSEDCSGYIRDIFKCFGLELPRNTTWQQAMPVKKYDMSELGQKERHRLLDKLPLGAVLYMEGHVMLYLGKENEEYYCISAVGTVMNETRTETIPLRCISINPLIKTYRPDNTSWLDNLTAALVIWE
ncbi:MAG: NlpC/P60 family protein [Eubacteriales bacterium]|nr:NlpC/P60 family protein [Eubacteriales bacterium]